VRERVELLCEGLASVALPADHAQHHEAAYVAELEHFAQVTAGGAPRGADGDDAVAALKLAVLARRSAVTGAPVGPRALAVA
jgi:predicted dehydrogenase